MSGLRLTQTGSATAYTTQQLSYFHKLPPGIVISKILPFVGGVRSAKSIAEEAEARHVAKIADLQLKLKRFLTVADDTIRDWYHSGSVGGSGEPQFLNREGSNWTDEIRRRYNNWWGQFKYKIDSTIKSARGADTEYRYRYKQADLNIDTIEWLRCTVDAEQIPMIDFELLPLETWLFYAELYRPKRLVEMQRY